MELDSSVGSLCAAAQGTDETMGYPTFSLALASLPDGHWSAITPAAPLRFWRMIGLSGDRSLTQDRLRIDERILHYLTGVQYIEERLTSLVEPVSATDDVLSPTQMNVAERIIPIWESGDSSRAAPVVHLGRGQ